MNLIFALLLSQFTQAQGVPADLNPPDINMLMQSGNLVSVQIAIGEPLRVFVIGKEEAKLDLSQLKLTIRQLNPYPGRILTTTRQGDYFTLPQNTNLDEPMDLEVKTKLQNKEETFRFKISNKKP